MSQTFQKTEILKSKTVFGELVQKGASTKKYPFVLLWKKMENSQEFPLRIAFSVSKKRFPLAVDRNAMKRKIREIYRLNKNNWYAKLDANYAVLLIYTSNVKRKTAEMETQLKKVFDLFLSHAEPNC
jgi:ribonuclease P protein component